MGGALAGMVDEGDSGVVVALQGAEIGQERGDLTGGILIDRIQAHKRVEDEEFWLQVGNGGLQGLLMFSAIEAQGGHGDDMDVETFEVDAGGVGDALEALSI
jgi:hypothetical protein